jgi:prepilin-type N-terminal cleavage/methylation domain-containing protein
MLKKLKLNNSGFTLIELLIVIVIIGILAGVVIGVLNPVQQQNRARDASVQSSLNKMALAGKSLFVSSPRTNNRAPTAQEFAAGVGNYQAPVGGAGVTDCATLAHATDAGPIECHFTIQGLTLPSNCANAYNGDGGGTSDVQCNFVYYRDDATGGTGDMVRMGARGAAEPYRMFIYHYLEDQSAGGGVTEAFFSCADATTAIDADYSNGTDGLLDLCDQLN